MPENEGRKKCFVIMPITMPPVYLTEYQGQKNHFIQVYSKLFAPAIEQAGLIPISPNSKGSDLIHATIIRNLHEADLVLCDMSVYNPNVFFELGVRTALNKPVCYVRDESVQSIPFDNAMIHTHDYKRFPDYDLNDEIGNLANHIKNTLDQSKGVNQLWKHFGVSAQADLLGEQVEDPKHEQLLFEIMSLKRAFQELKYSIKNDAFDNGEILDIVKMDIETKGGKVSLDVNHFGDMNLVCRWKNRRTWRVNIERNQTFDMRDGPTNIYVAEKIVAQANMNMEQPVTAIVYPDKTVEYFSIISGRKIEPGDK